MKHLIALCILFGTHSLFAQSVEDLHGRWAFTGLRTTILKVEKGKLFVGMLEYSDTSNFSRFLRNDPVDSSVFVPAQISFMHDTISIDASFTNIDHRLRLLYSPKDSKHILYTGDVFFDSAQAIIPNKNCSSSLPTCVNRLYNSDDIRSIMSLHTPESFTRDDAFEFLLRLNGKLQSKCNRCYAGFTDAYMNEVLIDMGFNPIIKRVAAHSVWYNTSGFTFFVKSKFQNDERITRLAEYVFDRYILQDVSN
jgi:hypothetical protein